MSSRFKSCRGFREQVSLHVSGALSAEDRADLERHLVICAECRKYQEQIAKVAIGLVDWKQSAESITPSAAALARWREDFAQNLKPTPSLWDLIFAGCKDMIWPYRRIWAGFAIIWTLLLVFNLSNPDRIRLAASKALSPSPELVRAFFHGEGFSESTDRAARNGAVPVEPNPPSSERNPSGRSVNSNSI